MFPRPFTHPTKPKIGEDVKQTLEEQQVIFYHSSRGGIRTHTPCEQRILSPFCLPFQHSAKVAGTGLEPVLSTF